MAGDFTGALKLRTSQPQLPPLFVRRPRLDAKFAAGSAGAITVVSAGAGYGKTLAVTAWIASGNLPGPVVWLTTDHSYDVRGFWTDLLDALRIRAVLPVIGPLRELAPGPRFGIAELDRIVEALTHLPGPVVLVLDDFQNIDDAQVLDFLSRVLERRIPQLRLILVTRTEPQLRLARLRLADQVTEINGDDLAFTPGEAHEVCVLSGHPLVGHDLADLLRRTQGWPVGLRLALISLSDPRADPGLGGFGGNNRRVAEYLLEEVLDQLPAGDRRFLLATSVADQMTAELARQLTGRSDSGQVLENLVARNALTVRLSDRPNWFRYHPLLRELLRDRLVAENPDGVFELNRRAAQWYATENESITAIRHYSLARDWDAVLKVLGSAAMPLMLSSQASDLVSALSLADAEAALRPTLPTLLAAMVCAYQRHDYDSMARHTEAAARLLDENCDPEPAAVIIIAVARMVHTRTFTLRAIVEASSHLLHLADELPRRHVPAAPAYSLIASNNRAIGLALEGRLEEAYVGLTAARATAAHIGMGLLELAATSYLSLVDAMAGDTIRARALSATAFEFADRRGWSSEPQLVAAVAAAALVDFQANDLDAAQHHIDSGLSAALPETDVGSRLILDIIAVGVATARRDVVEARLRLKHLDTEQAGVGELSDFMTRWIRVAHAEVALLAGDPQETLTMIADPGSAVDFVSALERVARARALLALADPASALKALGPAKQFDDYRIQAVAAAIIESIASLRLHRDRAAAARFADAVSLAQPISAIAPFIATAADIAPQLTRHDHLTDQHRDFVTTVIGATRSVQTPLGSVPLTSPPNSSLTERELAVLQYLPTLLRAADIADDLFVSVNTVKSHMRGIYSKLGVSTRREAVQRAKECRLL